MVIVLGILVFLAFIAVAYVATLWLRERSNARRMHRELQGLRLEAAALRDESVRLSKWTTVADADDKARELIAHAEAMLSQAESDARILLTNAEQHYASVLEKARAEAAEATAEGRSRSKQLMEEAQAALGAATARAAKVIAEAHAQAEQIAGKAYDAVRNAELFERTARAMKNRIAGYGDEYLVPASSFVDDLAEEFSHKDAGRQLKLAREHTANLIKLGQASRCEYVEPSRRQGAERFVLDAFNGKVDSILSRVRHDNAGTLQQEIHDAFTIVNYGGQAFRLARITDQYLAARLQELRWATAAQELKRQEQEEQRRIREQIREEEKARREYERAMRESAKEQELLRKAMAKAQAQIAAATEEQRFRYESQLQELQVRLAQAEEKGQRALSMAQLTRRGHVYIISNVGSLGESVYKIGLTRRLDPLDRVKELGDSSVPFDFDVHAMILSDDAPALENQLHKHFIVHQVNKVNHRKEFFRANLAEIRREIESLGIEAHWTMVADAAQYRETLAIERAIASDAAACEAWLTRQLTLDPVDHDELLLGAGDGAAGSPELPSSNGGGAAVPLADREQLYGAMEER